MDKMKDCRWLRPELTARFEFLEWTEDRHLRHSRFCRAVYLTTCACCCVWMKASPARAGLSLVID